MTTPAPRPSSQRQPDRQTVRIDRRLHVVRPVHLPIDDDRTIREGAENDEVLVALDDEGEEIVRPSGAT